MDVTAHVLLTLAAVVVVGRCVGWLFAYIGQPPVIGEVIAGIMLGPSLLGLMVPGGPAWLLPPAVAPYLREIAQLGVILYMFLVGLELNAGQVRQRAWAAVFIAHASIIVPFVCGAVLGLVLYEGHATAGVPIAGFALFMGAAMAITAFPVLARILTDRGMSQSELGVMALTGCSTGADPVDNFMGAKAATSSGAAGPSAGIVGSTSLAGDVSGTASATKFLTALLRRQLTH